MKSSVLGVFLILTSSSIIISACAGAGTTSIGAGGSGAASGGFYSNLTYSISTAGCGNDDAVGEVIAKRFGATSSVFCVSYGAKAGFTPAGLGAPGNGAGFGFLRSYFISKFSFSKIMGALIDMISVFEFTTLELPQPIN